MRAARMPALRALSRPTAATGTPGGIWITERIASRPLATDRRLESGTPIHGQVGVRRNDTGQRSGKAGAGDQDAQAASAGAARNTRRPRRAGDEPTAPGPRGRCRDRRAPWRRPASCPCHSASPSGSRRAADRRRSARRRSRAVARRSRVRPCLCGDVAAQLLAVELDHLRRSIRRRPAPAGSSPSAVTPSTRPPLVTISRPRWAVPACVTSTPGRPARGL